MKYFEFTFHTSPCTETVNDVLTAVLGEVGFDSRRLPPSAKPIEKI